MSHSTEIQIYKIPCKNARDIWFCDTGGMTGYQSPLVNKNNFSQNAGMLKSENIKIQPRL